MIDWQEIAENTQQSSRPDKISKRQAGRLSQYFYTFQNVPFKGYLLKGTSKRYPLRYPLEGTFQKVPFKWYLLKACSLFVSLALFIIGIDILPKIVKTVIAIIEYIK